MIHWKRQNEALVGEVPLCMGGQGTVVLVAGRSNPRGAVLVLTGDAGPTPLPFPEAAEYLSAENYIDVLAAQERKFGTYELPPLEGE